MLVDMECPRFHSRFMIRSAINVLLQMLSLRLVWVTDKVLLKNATDTAWRVPPIVRLTASVVEVLSVLLCTTIRWQKGKGACGSARTARTREGLRDWKGWSAYLSRLMDEAMLSR